jgi:hypothetical protein
LRRESALFFWLTFSSVLIPLDAPRPCDWADQLHISLCIYYGEVLLSSALFLFSSIRSFVIAIYKHTSALSGFFNDSPGLLYLPFSSSLVLSFSVLTMFYDIAKGGDGDGLWPGGCHEGVRGWRMCMCMCMCMCRLNEAANCKSYTRNQYLFTCHCEITSRVGPT